MGPSGSLIKGCGCTGTWAWSSACRAVPFPRAVAILPGCELPPEQDTHTAQALWLKGHIYSRNNVKEHTQDTSSVFPARTTLLPYEPWWATISTQNSWAQGTSTDSPKWLSHHQAVLSHKPAASHSFVTSVHDKSQQSTASGVPAASGSHHDGKCSWRRALEEHSPAYQESRRMSVGN